MVTDPPHFCARLGASLGAKLEQVQCPAHRGWRAGEGWIKDRTPAARGGTDNEGWFYAQLFSSFDAALAQGKTNPSSRRMFCRRRRWYRRTSPLRADERRSSVESRHTLVVRSVPKELAVPGEYSRSLLLSEVAWRGFVGRYVVQTGANWFQRYYVLLRPGVARLRERADGSLPPPEASAFPPPLPPSSLLPPSSRWSSGSSSPSTCAPSQRWSTLASCRCSRTTAYQTSRGRTSSSAE